MICQQPGCCEQATVKHSRHYYCRLHYRDVHLAHMKSVCQRRREAKIDELERTLDEITPGGYDRSSFYGQLKVHRSKNGRLSLELA